MGHRNMRMKYVGKPGPRPAPDSTRYGPEDGQEPPAIRQYLEKNGAKSPFEIAVGVGIPEHKVLPILQPFIRDGIYALDGGLVYAL